MFHSSKSHNNDNGTNKHFLAEMKKVLLALIRFHSLDIELALFRSREKNKTFKWAIKRTICSYSKGLFSQLTI